METLGWNPLLDDRSHPSPLMFPGFAAAVDATTTTTITTSRSISQAGNRNSNHHQPRRPPQSASYPHRNQVKFSFNMSEFGDDDSLLPLTSPAISVSPGVFFDEAFNFPSSNAGNIDQHQPRSPSLGIGSSLDHQGDDGLWRPSSVAHFYFPKTGAELPYDMARAKSAAPGYQRPDSSADCRDDESPIDTEESSSEHWTDWNIKTASGCPPLDQLFDNKRRWREKFNKSVPPPLQRHCVFCKSISKPPSVYLSHAIRDANGEITCPVLNAYNCPKCGKRGHTVRYCALSQSQHSSSNSTGSLYRSQSPLPVAIANAVLNSNDHFPSSRLGSVSSFSDALSMMGGRSTKSSLGFY